jgi:hypothetical protein
MCQWLQAMYFYDVVALWSIVGTLTIYKQMRTFGYIVRNRSTPVYLSYSPEVPSLECYHMACAV